MSPCRHICLALILLATATSTGLAKGEETPWGKEVDGLRSRLIHVSGSKVGEPILVRLELMNVSKEARSYDDQQAAVNSSLEVKGPDGKAVPYMDLSYQTIGEIESLQPGKSATIIKELDVARQYPLDKPGAYTVQSRGRGGIPASNLLTIKLESGPVPPLTEVYSRLRAVAPAGWRPARGRNAVYLTRSPTGLKRDVLSIQLWFTKEKMSGFEGKQGPANLEYVGETRLGHAWLSANDGVKARWPKYAEDVRAVLRSFSSPQGAEEEQKRP